jgi:hypothetical protein
MISVVLAVCLLILIKKNYHQIRKWCGLDWLTFFWRAELLAHLHKFLPLPTCFCESKQFVNINLYQRHTVFQWVPANISMTSCLLKNLTQKLS